MDYNKLREEMRKKGISVNDMCRELNMSRSAFYRKSHGKTEFTRSEIEKIVDFLGIGSPVQIFLPRKCLKRY